jgi:hypothetical protein
MHRAHILRASCRGGRFRLERHAALRAGARRRLAHLRVHRTDVRGASRNDVGDRIRFRRLNSLRRVVTSVTGVASVCRRRRRRDVLPRISHELVATTRVAEIVHLPIVLSAAALGGLWLYGHPADGILYGSRSVGHDRSAGGCATAGATARDGVGLGMCMLVLAGHGGSPTGQTQPLRPITGHFDVPWL